jgi:hypothetical protein
MSQEPYEFSVWKSVKVHPDCHVQIDRCFYSVPFNYVGQSLRARVREKTLEIFTLHGDAITFHTKCLGIGKYSTYDQHYPEEKIQQTRFDIRSAKEKAKGIGPKTSELVEQVFAESHPLRRLRFVQGLLRLLHHDRCSKESLEYASSQALTFNRLRLSYITSCCKCFMTRPQISATSAPQRQEENMYLHKNYE